MEWEGEIGMGSKAEEAIGGADFRGGEEDGESGGASGFELIIGGVFDCPRGGGGEAAFGDAAAAVGEGEDF